jgi:hypothetical protein
MPDKLERPTSVRTKRDGLVTATSTRFDVIKDPAVPVTLNRYAGRRAGRLLKFPPREMPSPANETSNCDDWIGTRSVFPDVARVPSSPLYVKDRNSTPEKTVPTVSESFAMVMTMLSA